MQNVRATDYAGIRRAISGLAERIETGRRATSEDERRKNVDTVKGLVSGFFIESDPPPQIYGNHATTDIEAVIRRSEIELADFELKQGLLTLTDNHRIIDNDLLSKVTKTICAIANNGPKKIGKILIGVTDKATDAERIAKLDGIEPRKVGKRLVVGVTREAKALGITVERYFTKWKDAIKSSELSPALRTSVLSNIDYNSYYGLGVLVITVPAQQELSYLGEQVFCRNGDATELVSSAKQIAALAKRF